MGKAIFKMFKNIQNQKEWEQVRERRSVFYIAGRDPHFFLNTSVIAPLCSAPLGTYSHFSSLLSPCAPGPCSHFFSLRILFYPTHEHLFIFLLFSLLRACPLHFSAHFPSYFTETWYLLPLFVSTHQFSVHIPLRTVKLFNSVISRRSRM